MGNETHRLGRTGEAQAALYLKKKQYTILETNFRTRLAEVDIIAKKAGTLCFIEVKTRRKTTRGLAKESVTLAKQQKIIRAAKIYIQKKAPMDYRIRFDVIEVVPEKKGFHINMIKNAFQVE